MSAKDLVLDFINLIFLVLLIVLFIFYFIAGNHFAVFAMFMKAMVPLSFFGIIFLIKLKLTRREIKKRTSENRADLVLYLTVFQKLVSDVIIFGSPILLGLLIYKARGAFDAVDISLLVIVFLIMFFWQKYIFSKER